MAAMTNNCTVLNHCKDQSTEITGCVLHMLNAVLLFCLFDLILYVPSAIFQLNRDGSYWFEPVLS